MRIYLVQLLIILIVVLVEGQRWSDFNRVIPKNSKNGRSSAYTGEHDSDRVPEGNLPTKSQQNKGIGRGGIGGWGIIAITLTIIFSGMGIYYFVLFYPIVCKKERMYDVMEMTAV